MYGDGNHPIVAPFGEKHPIVSAKKIKFIWEDAQSLEPFNRLTADHAKETVSIFRKYSICHTKVFGTPREIHTDTTRPFQEWDDLVSKIPILLKEPPEEGFRRKVKRLDILDHTLLQTKRNFEDIWY